MRCFRKQPGGYMPFVIDINIDWCEFLKHRNNELMQRLFGMLEQNSNLHTKCPIDVSKSAFNFLSFMNNDKSFFRSPTLSSTCHCRVLVALNCLLSFRRAIIAWIL